MRKQNYTIQSTNEISTIYYIKHLVTLTAREPLLCRIALPSVSPILLLPRLRSGPPVDKFGLAHPVPGLLGCWYCLYYYYYYCRCFFLLSVGYRLRYPACDSQLFLCQHIESILAEIYTLSPEALFLRMQSIVHCGQSRTRTDG